MDNDQFKMKLASTFDDVSERYDQNRFFAISATKMAGLVPPFERLNVLDVSTGTGVVAIEVSRRFRHAKIEAFDLSDGMLNEAKKKARRQRLDNISFKQGDVEKMPYADGSFEVITCGYAMFFYTQMEAVYQSLCKLLKPGGVFLFSSFTKKAFSPYSKLFLERIEGDYNVEVPKGRMERLKTKEQMTALAALGHPQKITILDYLIRYTITVDQWWSLCNNAGFKALLDQLDSERLLEFKHAHLADMEAIANDGEIELNADTLFGMVRF